jgi:iron complex outermembrane receptor protein
MNHDNNDLSRAVRRALRCNPLGIQPRTAACASVLLAMGTTVVMAADAPQGATSTTLAQAATQPSNTPAAKTPDNAENQLEAITVTGIKASIASAISVKESSDDIIEAITAEDLGKLPDISIADSIARLPGLTAQRTDGRSNFISIRGFAADFSGTTLSGREQASTGENRGVEFDQFPAELISGVQVYKTTDASLIGQGLAGTVNLTTVRPLAFKDLTMAVNARAEHNTDGNLNPGQGVSDNGHRVSISIVDQFFDRTLGVAVGFAQLDSPVQEKQYQAGYWDQDNGDATTANLPPPAMKPLNQCCGTPTVVGVPPLAIEEEYSSAYARSESQLRNGLMSVLEWAPNEHYHSQLDLFYSKFKEVQYTNGVQWSSAPWGGSPVGNPPIPFPIPSYSNVTTSNQNGNAIVTGGIISGIVPIMSNSYTNTATQNFSAGWNNKVTFDGDWTVAGDLSYSSARDKLHNAYTFSGLKGSVLNGIGFQIPVNNGDPNFSVPVNLADPTLVGFTDPANYSYDGRDENDRQSDVIKAFRLDIVHPVGWIFKTVDVGFDYSDRKKIKSAAVNFAYLLGNGCSTPTTNQCAGGPPYNNNLYTPVNSNLLYSPTSLSYVGIPGVQDYNVLSALSKQFYEVPDMGGNDYNRNYYVEEKVPLGYVKLNIDTTLASVAIRGNVGVQVVHTKQFSSSLLTDPNTGQPTGSVTGGTSYNEVLPSLNLVGDFGNRTLLRLGAGKQMMRGRIDDEKSSASASLCTNIANGCIPGQWSGSGGNPNLKPYIAIAEDLSFEKVFGQASAFSAALFKKSLTSYIYTQTIPNYDFSGFTSLRPAIGSYSTPQNGSGGNIQGYEVALTLEGNLLGSWLDGFGLQSSFAYTNNFIPLNTLSNVPGGPTTFPGFSKKVGALTLYYEKYGVSVRAAATYRSDFTGEIIALFDQLGYTTIKAETVTNLQAGYEFKQGAAKGLSILLQVNNLTNTPYQTSQTSNFNIGPVTTPLEYDTFGRTILLGVNYKIQ